MSSQLRLRAGLPISARAIRAHLGPHLEPRFLGWCCCGNSRLSLSRGNSALVACPFEEGTDEVSGPLQFQHLERSKSEMGQDRSVLSPKERARITELQDALVDRLFERRGSPEFNGFS